MVAQRVAGRGVLEADAGHDVAGVDRVEVLLVVGVHLEQATERAPCCLVRLLDLGALVERGRSRRGSR